MSNVVVLNQDMTILGSTSVKKAIRLIVKDKAEVLVESNDHIHPSMLIPKVIRLIKAIRSLWKKEVKWAKSAVHVRDSYTCQYCGEHIHRKKATIDHVLPKALGGKNSWSNTVTACRSCNNKKGSKSLTDSGMSLKRKPFKPTIMEFLLLKVQQEGLAEILKELGIY